MSSRWVSTGNGDHLRGRRKEHTEPERLLRSALHLLGARFRLHRRIAPCCTPDLVLPRRGIAVFVDGDFWHSCPEHGRKVPFTGPNADLWTEKLRRNQERDSKSTRLAEEAGWTVVRVWECAVRADPIAVARAVLAGRQPGPARNAKSSSPRF